MCLLPEKKEFKNRSFWHVVKTAVQVQACHNFGPLTIALSVNYMDRFMSRHHLLVWYSACTYNVIPIYCDRSVSHTFEFWKFLFSVSHQQIDVHTCSLTSSDYFFVATQGLDAPTSVSCLYLSGCQNGGDRSSHSPWLAGLFYTHLLIISFLLLLLCCCADYYAAPPPHDSLVWAFVCTGSDEDSTYSSWCNAGWECGTHFWGSHHPKNGASCIINFGVANELCYTIFIHWLLLPQAWHQQHTAEGSLVTSQWDHSGNCERCVWFLTDS